MNLPGARCLFACLLVEECSRHISPIQTAESRYKADKLWMFLFSPESPPEGPCCASRLQPVSHFDGYSNRSGLETKERGPAHTLTLPPRTKRATGKQKNKKTTKTTTAAMCRRDSKLPGAATPRQTCYPQRTSLLVVHPPPSLPFSTVSSLA